MQEKIRTIRLYGYLGTRFGREFRIAVNSTREAIRALCVLVPGFETELIQSQSKGIAYTCFVGKKNLKSEELTYPVGDNAIRIAPVVIGSKRGGLLQIIGGIALIVASVYTGGAAAGAAGSAGGAAAAGGAGAAAGASAGAVAGTALATAGGMSLGPLGMIGVSLALGSVSQLLSPQAKGTATKDGVNNTPSYNFNGAVNTTAEGNPVPLIYGRIQAGGAVASAGIFAENQF